jgi:hypothetical protein
MTKDGNMYAQLDKLDELRKHCEDAISDFVQYADEVMRPLTVWLNEGNALPEDQQGRALWAFRMRHLLERYERESLEVAQAAALRVLEDG